MLDVLLLDMSDWTLDKVFFSASPGRHIAPTYYRCTGITPLEIGHNMRDAWSCRGSACATRIPPLSSQYALGLHYGGAALSSPVVATPLIPSICSCRGSMQSIHRGAVIVPSSGTCRPRRLYRHALLTTWSGSRSCHAPANIQTPWCLRTITSIHFFWKALKVYVFLMAISCIWAWVYGTFFLLLKNLKLNIIAGFFLTVV